MSIPTDDFADLSLRDMPLPEEAPEEARTRAIEIQDILSAFDPDVYPNDFELRIFDHIDRPVSERPSPNSWTVPGNLNGTLLTFGSWNENFGSMLGQIATPKYRATAFTEKLQRQCNEVFKDYESLKEKPPPNLEDLKQRLSNLAHRLSSWSEAIHKDQNTRRMEEAETREADTLQIALETLRRICNSAQPITPPSSATGGPSRRTRARATSLSDQNLSLFAVLIKAPSASKQPFLLDTLEQFTGPALKQHKGLLLTISGLLDSIAPRDYTNRFDALQEKAEDETALPKVQAVLGGRKRGHEAEPTTGTEVTPKRGKRTGGR